VIGLFLYFALATAPTPPAELVVSTPRGETRMPILRDAAGMPLLPAAPLAAALNGTSRRMDAWAEVVIARQTFEFLLDAGLVRFNGRLEPLAAPATVRHDSLFVPYQFVAEMLPRFFGERYHFDGATGHLIEVGPPAPVAPKRLLSGLLPGHIVTVDAGHGGDDPGNPGRFFPSGVREKHVTLQVALLLRAELEKRGVKVRMTRTTDVRPNLLQRAPTCDATCDLFVSLHVDALDPRRRPDYRSFAGFSTLIIGEENSADADRVAETENEALRFESPDDQRLATGPLAFILRDLQMNEYLRESARAAALVQQHLDRVHPGPDRGVKQRNDLAVLNTGRRPGVLVEMGYSSNPSDADFMSSRAGQQKIARVLTDAIVTYLMEFERKTGMGADSTGPMQ
jgi:N-acetylmuramoyl-L-alanine amidase